MIELQNEIESAKKSLEYTNSELEKVKADLKSQTKATKFRRKYSEILLKIHNRIKIKNKIHPPNGLNLISKGENFHKGKHFHKITLHTFFLFTEFKIES